MDRLLSGVVRNLGLSPKKTIMSQPAKRNKVRLTLEFDQDIRAIMEDLKERSGAASVTEVIRKALAVYNHHLDHQSNDGVVLLKHSDGSVERLTII